MELTRLQEEGLKIAIERYRAKEPYTCIAGYAGVGKSTLVQFIIAALGLPAEEVAYITFTGKAASVLRQKGCPNAMTAHKLLYYSKRMPNGKYIFRPRKTLEGEYKLIIVDEISMLPKDLWELLLSHKKHVIALGDPFQIPPIDKNADNHVLDNPHIFLDKIMRQAQESEIIRLTMGIRERKNIDYYKGDQVMIVRPEEVVDGMYFWADQIICATNKKRNETNNFLREVEGRGKEPEVGDKVICCRNCWDIIDSSGENALVNGTIGFLDEYEKVRITYPIYKMPSIEVIRAKIITPNDGNFENVLLDPKTLDGGSPSLDSRQAYQIYKHSELKHLEPIEFNYGSAITGHKAQGSEWDRVLILEERFPFDEEEHARWLYTGCTRASEKLVLVR